MHHLALLHSIAFGHTDYDFSIQIFPWLPASGEISEVVSVKVKSMNVNWMKLKKEEFSDFMMIVNFPYSSNSMLSNAGSELLVNSQIHKTSWWWSWQPHSSSSIHRDMWRENWAERIKTRLLCVKKQYKTHKKHIINVSSLTLWFKSNLILRNL